MFSGRLPHWSRWRSSALSSSPSPCPCHRRPRTVPRRPPGGRAGATSRAVVRSTPRRCSPTDPCWRQAASALTAAVSRRSNVGRRRAAGRRRPRWALLAECTRPCACRTGRSSLSAAGRAWGGSHAPGVPAPPRPWSASTARPGPRCPRRRRWVTSRSPARRRSPGGPTPGRCSWWGASRTPPPRRPPDRSPTSSTPWPTPGPGRRPPRRTCPCRSTGTSPPLCPTGAS